MKFLETGQYWLVSNRAIFKHTDPLLPIQAPAPPAHLVGPAEGPASLLPLHRYREVSGWGCDTVDPLSRESEGSAASGEIEIVYGGQTVPESYPVIGIHPDQIEKVEEKTNGMSVEDDSHHAFGAWVHHGNH